MHRVRLFSGDWSATEHRSWVSGAGGIVTALLTVRCLLLLLIVPSMWHVDCCGHAPRPRVNILV